MSKTLTRPVKPRKATSSCQRLAVMQTIRTVECVSAAEAEAVAFEASSGNVFADLDVPDAGDEAIKARLVMRLRAEMDRRGLNQTEFAKVLGVKQPDVSNLLRGRVLGFSLERMFEFTRALGDDVEITLRPSKAERRGRMSLKVA